MKLKYRKLNRKETGYKYKLLEPMVFDVPGLKGVFINTEYITIFDGKMFIRSGYAWDGPSGPTIDTENFMAGSLAHDALYQLMREGHLAKEHRKYADEKLKKICIFWGMSNFRAWYVYKAVRLFF